MNVKPFLIRCILILALTVAFLSINGTSAYAAHKVGGTGGSSGRPITCPPRGCDPQQLAGDILANDSPLYIEDYSSVKNKDILLKGVDGASANPKDIEDLVKDAITVWEAAFDDESLPKLTIHAGWADFKLSQNAPDGSFLTGRLVGNVRTAGGEIQEEPANTRLPSATGDVLGLHICGAPFDSEPLPDENDCSGSVLNEATILFNSEPLKIRESNGETREVKRFLDSDPLNSKVFGPIQDIGDPGDRVEALIPQLSEQPYYVVDLFTVALHEVGHALGYSEINQNVSLVGNPPSAHINDRDIPDVLSQYVPFSTRKCPSREDVEGLQSVDSNVPDAPKSYVVISSDPCSEISTRKRNPALRSKIKIFIGSIVGLILLIVGFLRWRKGNQAQA